MLSSKSAYGSTLHNDNIMSLDDPHCSLPNHQRVCHPKDSIWEFSVVIPTLTLSLILEAIGSCKSQNIYKLKSESFKYTL